MSYVVVAPEMMTSAASDLAGIGSNVEAAHMVATARTTSVIPAAADEVSTGIAHLFSQHAASYHALAGQASAFHEHFVQNLTAGAHSCATAEATSASFLQDLNANADQVLNSLLIEATELGGDIFVASVLALILALILAEYAAAAGQHFLMTGQFLSWSAFLSELFANLPPLFPGGYPG